LIQTLGEHRNSCFSIFKGLESCPRSHIIQKGELLEIFLEFIWVVSSMLPYLICFAILIHTFTRKTYRSFLIFTNLLLQQIICIALKKYMAQHRPIGACSSSYGYPSSHSGFTSSLAIWLILEAKLIHNKAHFKLAKNYPHMRNAFVCFAPLVPISRYFLNYHSIEQILVGLIAGTMITVPYFFFIHNLFTQKGNKSVYGNMIIKTCQRYSFQDNFFAKHHIKEEDF